MALTPSIDVVVPVHNGWATTRRCLECLQAQTLAHAVIVCDNGSTDDTVERVRDAFSHVLLIQLGSNLGFPVACNRGVAAGTADVVVLLNNDVEFSADFLEHLVAPLSASDSVGSAVPLLLRPGEDSIDSFGLAVDATLAGYPRLRGLPVRAAQSTRPRLIGPTGAAGAYRRRAWEDVGGLDEGVFAYGEDVDLAVRLRAVGWAAAGAADAVATHIGSVTAVARSAWQRYQAGFSRGYFLRRNGILRSKYATRAVATELIAVAGDALVYSHDLAGLRGRLAGWRAAAGRPRHGPPPGDAVDLEITFTQSLRLRRSVYRCTSG